MSNQVEQTADRLRDPDDPYVRGWEEGKKFAEDRAANLSRLEYDSRELSCIISRDVWRKALSIWQEDTKSPGIYISPESLLLWLWIRIPELQRFNSFSEGQGHIKGFLEGRGIKVKTGQL